MLRYIFILIPSTLQHKENENFLIKPCPPLFQALSWAKSEGALKLIFLEKLYLNSYYPSEDNRPSHKDYIKATASVDEQTKIILYQLGTDGDKILDEYLSAKVAKYP